jgi:hypothetical protein
VGERLKPAVLKNKTVIRYLAENTPNPFAGRKIAPISVFGTCLILRRFTRSTATILLQFDYINLMVLEV